MLIYQYSSITILLVQMATIANAFVTQVCRRPDLHELFRYDVGWNHSNRHYDSFTYFIETAGHFWPDKSLFIENIMKHKENIIVIHSPRLWYTDEGLLPMLQAFLGITVEKNHSLTPLEKTFAYNYFVKGEIPLRNNTMQKIHPVPLISQHQDLIKEALGQYPVIYLRFTGTSSDLISDALKSITHNIASFQYVCHGISKNNHTSPELKYLAKKFIKIHRSGFEGISHEELLKSVQNLSKLLHAYFGKKVVIIFIAYDRYIEKLYFNELEQYGEFNITQNFVFKFYKEFSKYTFHSNEYLEKAIITVGNPTALLLGLNGTDIKQYNFIDGDDIYMFFGNTENEISDMMKIQGIEDTKKDYAVKRFGGYKCPNAPSGHTFIPFVENHFVRNKKHEFPLFTTQRIFCLQDYTVFRDNLKSLKNGETYDVEYSKIRWPIVDDFRLISLYLRNRPTFAMSASTYNESAFRKDDFDRALAILCGMGYINVDTTFAENGKNGTHIRLKVPNQLMLTQIPEF